MKPTPEVAAALAVPDDRPPVLKSWSQVYLFVLLLHLLLIIGFYLFSLAYTPDGAVNVAAAVKSAS